MVFVDWFEPGYKAGGPIQSSKNLALAMSEDYDVRVVCTDRDLNDSRPYDGIEPFVWQAYAENVEVYYTRPGSMGLGRIRRLIRETAPSCLYVNGIFSPRFSVLPVIAGRLEKVRTVVSPRGMLQHGSMRFKRVKKETFVMLMRLIGLHGKTVFQATDEQEAEDVSRRFPENGGVHIIPNLLHPTVRRPYHTAKSPGRLSLVFLSRISRKKNLDFLLRVISGLPVDCRVSLTVAGQVEEPEYWRQCESIMGSLPSHVEVEAIGPLPNRELEDFYRRFHVFILPTHGENFGHAILEAMLNSKPVIISDRTPWTGLAERKAGFDIPLGDVAGFREAIRGFAMSDQAGYDRWAEGAFDFARERQKANDELKSRYQGIFA